MQSSSMNSFWSLFGHSGRSSTLVLCLAIFLLICLSGCGGCDADKGNQKGARTKTSMAGQPEEYLDATRLDSKYDSTEIASAESILANKAMLDSFNIAVDTELAKESHDTASSAPR